MKTIGIRASSAEIRYAILSKSSNGDIVFENMNTENRLVYPANTNGLTGKLSWVKMEIERILRVNADTTNVILKTNEYGQESSAKRETTYIDSVIILSCAENNIDIDTKIYSQIGTNSAGTKKHAELRVGKTDKYWNNTIADAVNCAFWSIKDA